MRWKEMLPNAEVFPLSAKEHFNVPPIMIPFWLSRSTKIVAMICMAVSDSSNFSTILARVAKEKIPVLLVINKIDLLKTNGDLEAIVSRQY